MGRIPYRYESAENSLAETEALLDRYVAVLGGSEPNRSRVENLQAVPSHPLSGVFVLSTDWRFDHGQRWICLFLPCCRTPAAGENDIETSYRSVRLTARRVTLVSRSPVVGLIEAAILGVPLRMNVHGVVEFDTHDRIATRTL